MRKSGTSLYHTYVYRVTAIRIKVEVEGRWLKKYYLPTGKRACFFSEGRCLKFNFRIFLSACRFAEFLRLVRMVDL